MGPEWASAVVGVAGIAATVGSGVLARRAERERSAETAAREERRALTDLRRQVYARFLGALWGFSQGQSRDEILSEQRTAMAVLAEVQMVASAEIAEESSELVTFASAFIARLEADDQQAAYHRQQFTIRSWQLSRLMAAHVQVVQEPAIGVTRRLVRWLRGRVSVRVRS